MDSDYLSDEMQFGIQFHYLASILEDKTAIKSQLKKSISEGEVSQSNAKELENKLNDLFENPEYAGLFESKKEVLNEQAIIVDETTTLIPDKIILKENQTIIIDYKTGLPGNKDIKQVKSYQTILESMGYPNVSCYLYYSSLGELRLV